METLDAGTELSKTAAAQLQCMYIHTCIICCTLFKVVVDLAGTGTAGIGTCQPLLWYLFKEKIITILSYFSTFFLLLSFL